MNFNGINGERREAILGILHGQSMSAFGIVVQIEREGDTQGLLVRHGRTESIQKVLREMERRGEVKRERPPGHDHIWSLA